MENKSDPLAETDVGKLLPYPGVALSTPADDSPAITTINAHTGSTQRGTRDRLNIAARLMGYADYTTCPFETWRRREMLKFHKLLADKVQRDEYVPRSARLIMQSVAAVLKEAWRQGHMNHDDYQRAIDTPPIKGTKRRREILTASEADFTRTLIGCLTDRTGKGLRDAALVALSSVAGLRSKEYADLDVADIDLTRQTVRIRDGKGQHDRLIYFNRSVVSYLADYLALRGPTPGPFFIRMSKAGDAWRQSYERLAPDAVTDIFVRRSTAAGRRLTTHAFRRGASTRTIRLTDAPTAMKLLGHASLETTMRHYYFPEEDALFQAAERVSVPLPGLRVSGKDVPTEETPPVSERLASVLAAMLAGE